MSIESKTPFPISPEGVVMRPDRTHISSTTSISLDQTVVETIERKLNDLIAENGRLRLEIKALQAIIKNINN